ncbi:amino acid adenylation domain-containing protein [Streptomyces sp. NPDC059605]|uniref:non-ribosomal peptide synthetase n=1 Tax=unclassified Streptomyces TaxID=2593676 RepID=UPI003685EDFC
MSDSLDQLRGAPVGDKQRALWMLHRLAAGRGICNLGFGLRVDAPLRWWPLQEALDQLVRRHPGLRTTFADGGAEPLRRCAPAAGAQLSLETVAATEDRLDALITEFVAAPFDVENGPLIRALLVALPTGSVLCFAAHHLVADWTTALSVLREAGRLYDTFADGRDVPADLLGEVEEAEDPAPDEEALRYWEERLAGVDTEGLALAGARPVSSAPTFAGDRVDRDLGPAAGAAVARLRARTRSSDNIVMLAAYCVLLARHGAGPDLVVGVPVSSRRSDTAQSFGYHVSTLPIRVEVDPERGFDELVGTVRKAFLEGLEHSAASFESVQRRLGAGSAEWRAPLFRHTFNYRPLAASDEELSIAGRPARQIDAGHGMSRLDLDLIVFAGPQSLELTGVYSTEAHDRPQIEALIDRYRRLLVALDADPGAAVGSVDLATDADRLLEAAVNATTRSWTDGDGDGGGPSVAEQIFAQGLRTPDARAVGDWTYRHLLERAAGVAGALGRQGVGPGDIVALYLERGPELAAAALGVWTAGAAYLPLDPAHPAERGARELADGGVRVLVSDLPVPADWADGRTVLAPEGSAPPVPPVAGPLAYLIHTSGSTGRPKGIEVGHRALANVIGHFAELLEADADDCVLWLTTFSFDIAALELFLPLTVGARVVAADDRTRLSAGALATLIGSERITVAQATPTTWRLLAPELGDRLAGLRVLCGGEALTAALAERLLAAGCRLFNAYGPTETTVWSTVAELRSPVPARVPIGRPIANTTVTVRDGHHRPLPPGVPGELCVGGDGVAAGYHGDPARTAELFRTDALQGRYYRTGDEVLLTADGDLVHLGRLDRQLKIRGRRIEPGEVESVFESHPEVAAAAAFALADPDGETTLAVAVRPSDPADDTGPDGTGPDGTGLDDALAARLREHAGRFLAGGALPTRILVVGSFPLTGNGKVDHGALAAAARTGAAESPELPADPVVRTIVDVWRELLGDRRIGASSHFFLSGGHSLAAVRAAERLTTILGTEIGFDAVFSEPTPVLLAARIAETRCSR